MTFTNPNDLPLAWWSIEQTAESIISSGNVALLPAAFEFRAARDVLGLTLLLTGPPEYSSDVCGFPKSAMCHVQELLRDDEAWRAWISTGLASADIHGHFAWTDLRAAHAAFRWLTRGHVLGYAAFSSTGTISNPSWSHESGYYTGLRLARRIVFSLNSSACQVCARTRSKA